jgi:hypothetical protein
METTSRANDDMNRDLVPCLVVRIHLFLACLFGSKTFARFTQCHQHGTRHESAWSATSTAVHSQALKAVEVLSYTKSASSVFPRWSNVVLGVYGVRLAEQNAWTDEHGKVYASTNRKSCRNILLTVF